MAISTEVLPTVKVAGMLTGKAGRSKVCSETFGISLTISVLPERQAMWKGTALSSIQPRGRSTDTWIIPSPAVTRRSGSITGSPLRAIFRSGFHVRRTIACPYSFTS